MTTATRATEQRGRRPHSESSIRTPPYVEPGTFKFPDDTVKGVILLQ